MGAALQQAEPDLEAAREAEMKEIAGSPCAFDKTLKDQDLRLKRCSMISR